MKLRRPTTFRASAIVLAAVLCGSCSRSFLIEPSGFGANVRLEFRDEHLLGSTRMEACVSRITVSEEQWPTRAFRAVVWQAVSKGKCVTLTGIDVGHVPDGFTEDINRLPLKVGKMYGASAEADPFGGGSMAWFVCKGAPESASWKNEYRLNDRPKTCQG